MQQVPHHKLVASVSVESREQQHTGNWLWREKQFSKLQLGGEVYNIDLCFDVITKTDEFEETFAKQVVSDFSSASEETKQILRSQMYVKS
jgi:hypothetical protein